MDVQGINRKIDINIILAGIQTILISVVYLIVYKLLIAKFGIDNLGLWSIVYATASLINIGNTGVSSSLIKYIAECNIANDQGYISEILSTSLVIVISILTGLGLLLFFVGKFLLMLSLSEVSQDLGLSIFPVLLLSFWLYGIGGVLLSTFDGLHFSYLRSIIFILGTIVYVISFYPLVQFFGLKGIAYAHLCQSIVILVSGGLYLKLKFNGITFLPKAVNKVLYKKIFNFSAKLQSITLLQLFYEPSVKYVISLYGGLNNLGIYELANKIVLQVRSIVMSTNQVFLPYLSRKSEDMPSFIKFYNYYFKVNFKVALYVFFLICCGGPIASILFFDSVNIAFISVLIVIAMAYSLNTVSAPAYFSFMSTAKLRPLIISHLVIAIFNIIFGLYFGRIWGSYGVVIGWNLALICGSFLTIFFFHDDFKIKFQFDRSFNFFLFLGCAVSLFLILKLFYLELSWEYDIVVLFLIASFFLVFLKKSFHNFKIKSFD